MSEQVAQMYGSMYGEGNTEGTVSAVLRIDKSLAVHADGSRAEARKTAAMVSVVTSIALFIINVFVSIAAGFPMVGK
jgi:hypothetical protein